MAGIVHIENFGIKPTALEAINNNFEYLRKLAEAGGNEELVEAVNKLKELVDELVADNTELTNAISTVNGKVTDLISQYTQLNSDVNTLTATVNETREGMQTISSTVTALNPIVQDNKTKVAQHGTDIADLKTRVSALETPSPTSSIV